MDELRRALEVKVAASRELAAALDAEARTDDANLEKIRGNVYGIFVSVLQAAADHADGGAAQRELFETNLTRIPTGWRVSRDKAEERGDTVRLVQEETKLAALAEVERLYNKLWA